MINVSDSALLGQPTRPEPHRSINGRAVRTTVRWVLGLVVALHGLIHVLGAAKGLGWAEVSQLPAPIGSGWGAVWLAAAVVTVAAGLLLLGRVRWWWIIGGVAVVVSQIVIVTSWGDAKAGTIVNLALVVAVAYGWASQGPRGARAEYRRRAAEALVVSVSTELVSEADLAHLPAPIASYIRRSGAIGQPRVQTMHARFHGRIRSAASKPWMSFTGEQVNTFGTMPRRLFLMDAELFGLPVEVLHAFEEGAATMHVRALSMFTMVDAAGPAMDRGETVTIFNDLCVLAPAALIDAPVTWQVVDEHHIRGAYTYGINTVTAELTFNDDHELVDFVSDDRGAASTDGTFTPQRWSTPLAGYRSLGASRLATVGEAHWHAPDGEFAYLEFLLDDITFNAADLDALSTAGRS